MNKLTTSKGQVLPVDSGMMSVVPYDEELPISSKKDIIIVEIPEGAAVYITTFHGEEGEDEGDFINSTSIRSLRLQTAKPFKDGQEGDKLYELNPDSEYLAIGDPAYIVGGKYVKGTEPDDAEPGYAHAASIVNEEGEGFFASDFMDWSFVSSAGGDGAYPFKAKYRSDGTLERFEVFFNRD